MAAPRYVNANTVGPGLVQTVASTVGGVGSAETIPSLDVFGRFPFTMLPSVMANSLVANATVTAGDPASLAVAAGTLVGRAASGNLTALTAAQARLVLRLAAGTLTSAATINWDLATGLFFNLTIAQNFTLAFPSSPAAGETAFIYVTQDATGSRIITFNAAFKFAGGTAITLSTAANAVDRLEFFFHTAAAATVTITKDIK